MVFFVFGSAYILTSCVGLFNIGVHFLGTPQYELYVNVLRLILMLVSIPFLSSLTEIVWISSLIIFLGEVLLLTVVTMRYAR